MIVNKSLDKLYLIYSLDWCIKNLKGLIVVFLYFWLVVNVIGLDVVWCWDYLDELEIVEIDGVVVLDLYWIGVLRRWVYVFLNKVIL